MYFNLSAHLLQARSKRINLLLLHVNLATRLRNSFSNSRGSPKNETAISQTRNKVSCAF